MEDIGIVESVQRGLQNHAYRGGRMCFRFEDTIHRFQNHVIDKIISGEGVQKRDALVNVKPQAIDNPARQVYTPLHR
jgi:choline monooxygenase